MYNKWKLFFFQNRFNAIGTVQWECWLVFVFPGRIGGSSSLPHARGGKSFPWPRCEEGEWCVNVCASASILLCRRCALGSLADLRIAAGRSRSGRVGSTAGGSSRGRVGIHLDALELLGEAEGAHRLGKVLRLGRDVDEEERASDRTAAASLGTERILHGHEQRRKKQKQYKQEQRSERCSYQAHGPLSLSLSLSSCVPSLLFFPPPTCSRNVSLLSLKGT